MARILPSGVQIPDEDDWIWRIYHDLCVVCRNPAVCIHEDPPKSLNPSWREEPWNRFALCNHHHLYVHELPREAAHELLTFWRRYYIPDAEELLRAREKTKKASP